MREAAKLDEDNFWLHKFRATFATRCLWAGVQGFHLLTVSSLWFQHFLMTEWRGRRWMAVGHLGGLSGRFAPRT